MEPKDSKNAGLGGLVPYEDFTVDEIVPVSIWGKVVDAPVTSIEAVSGEGVVVDWRVHVGGELLADPAARLRSNRDLERDIALERRQRKVETSRAQSTADVARSDASRALTMLGPSGSVGSLVDRMDGLLSGEVSPERDSALWSLQQEINRAQEDVNAAQRRINETQAQINEAQGVWNAQREQIEVEQAAVQAALLRKQTTVLGFGANGTYSNAYAVLKVASRSLAVTATGTWTGSIVLSSRISALSDYSLNYAWRVTAANRSRTFSVGLFESTGNGWMLFLPD